MGALAPIALCCRQHQAWEFLSRSLSYGSVMLTHSHVRSSSRGAPGHAAQGVVRTRIEARGVEWVFYGCSHVRSCQVPHVTSVPAVQGNWQFLRPAQDADLAQAAQGRYIRLAITGIGDIACRKLLAVEAAEHPGKSGDTSKRPFPSMNTCQRRVASLCAQPEQSYVILAQWLQCVGVALHPSQEFDSLNVLCLLCMPWRNRTVFMRFHGFKAN